MWGGEGGHRKYTFSIGQVNHGWILIAERWIIRRLICYALSVCLYFLGTNDGGQIRYIMEDLQRLNSSPKIISV